MVKFLFFAGIFTCISLISNDRKIIRDGSSSSINGNSSDVPITLPVSVLFDQSPNQLRSHQRQPSDSSAAIVNETDRLQPKLKGTAMSLSTERKIKGYLCRLSNGKLTVKKFGTKIKKHSFDRKTILASKEFKDSLKELPTRYHLKSFAFSTSIGIFFTLTAIALTQDPTNWLSYVPTIVGFVIGAPFAGRAVRNQCIKNQLFNVLTEKDKRNTEP